jgi:hypothetical protein
LETKLVLKNFPQILHLHLKRFQRVEKTDKSGNVVVDDFGDIEFITEKCCDACIFSDKLIFHEESTEIHYKLCAIAVL